jgi:hypothetical protein
LLGQPAIGAGDGPAPIDTARRVAGQFISGAFGPEFLAATATVPEQAAFEQFAVAADSAKNIQDLAKAVQTAFGKTLTALVADPVFASLYRNVRDTIVAVIILPTARSLALADFARLARRWMSPSVSSSRPRRRTSLMRTSRLTPG